MRILVVEDDDVKAGDIVAVLLSAGVAETDVHRAANGRDAREAMRAEQFDLAVVDLVLPLRTGEEPRRLGGLELVREVRDRDLYQIPLQFMVLSAYGDVVDEAGTELADEVLLVLRYEKASLVWRDRLERHVAHLRHTLATRSPSSSLQADICVVTAVRDPELTAVLELPWAWEEVEVLGDGTLYYRGRVATGGDEYLNIVAANCSRMGMVASAVLTSKMCMHFRPRVVAMCGILAAIKRDVGLGDIVVADPTWNYESGKRALMLPDGEPEFLSSPDHISLEPWMRERCAAIAVDHAFLDEVRRCFNGRPPATALGMHVGPVASGSSVVADAEYLRDARLQHRKLLAIEMETYGVFAAVHEAGRPRPVALSIKSVSDYADAEKSDELQRYAAYTSAAAFRHLIEKYVGPSWRDAAALR